MEIMHHSTSAQVKQVFAFPDVSRSVPLPMSHVREGVLNANAFSQGGSSFTRTLSHTQFLQPHSETALREQNHHRTYTVFS